MREEENVVAWQQVHPLNFKETLFSMGIDSASRVQWFGLPIKSTYFLGRKIRFFKILLAS